MTMRDMIYKTRGIVVRASESKENDRVLSVLTEDFGAIAVAAKGIRSIRNRNASACAPLCYSEFVLKRRGEMYVLSQADLIENFYSLREDYERLMYAAYIAKLALMCAVDAADAKELLRLCLNTLYMLQKRGEGGLLKTVFELRAAALMGLAPETMCRCGKRAEFFCVESAQAQCAEHRSASARALAPDALAVMEYILNEDLKAALSFTTTKEAARALASLSESFLLCHIGRLPEQAEYIKKAYALDNGEKNE